VNMSAKLSMRATCSTLELVRVARVVDLSANLFMMATAIHANMDLRRNCQ
jgi:hypothetical protein